MKSLTSRASSNPTVSLSTPAVTSSTSTPTTTSLDVLSLWTALLKGTQITGRKLFEQEKHGHINNEINAVWKSKGIGAKMHVGMLNTRLKEMWEDLGDGKEVWNLKAKDINDSMAGNILYR